MSSGEDDCEAVVDTALCGDDDDDGGKDVVASPSTVVIALAEFLSISACCSWCRPLPPTPTPLLAATES